MRNKFFVLILFLLISGFPSFGQKRMVSICTKDKDLRRLFALRDTTQKLHYLQISQILIRYKIGRQINTTTLKYERQLNPTEFVELPESLNNAKILDVSWKVGFIYFNPRGSESDSNKFSIYNYVDSSKVYSERTQLALHFGAGRAIHLIDGNIPYYKSAPASSIECSIKSKPKAVDADVYAVTEDDWENTYHFPSPPSNNVISTQIISRLFFNKVGNAESEIYVNLTDEPWIIIFDHRGVYTTIPLIPSKNNHLEYPVR